MANLLKPPSSGNTKEYSTIVSDENLQFNLQDGYDFYLVPPNKDDSDKIEMEIRFAPYYDGLTSWTDSNFKVKNIKVEFGTGIVVTEIIPTATGIWVGFVSNLIGNDLSVFGDLGPDSFDTSGLIPSVYDIEDRKNSVLYTKIENVRARTGVSFPSVVNRILSRQEEIQPYVPPGAKTISPKDNQTWISVRPFDIRLEYYNFIDHNQKIIGNLDKINSHREDKVQSNPTLGLSEGFYYFVTGQNRRPTAEQSSGEVYGEYVTNEQRDEAVAQASEESIQEARSFAYKNLLDYLGKDKNSLRAQDLEKYFVLVDVRVNTESKNPDNQKTIFALKAEYVDALPDNQALYHERFEADSETDAQFLSGRDYSTNFKVKNIQKITDNLIEQFQKFKSKVDQSKLRILDANDIEFDIEYQIKQIESIPAILNDFMSRQAYPAVTSQNTISNLALDGTGTDSDHILQLGLRDNDEIGYNVRETISYILFSPDPKSLIGIDAEGNETTIDLYNLDSYITTDELENLENAKRTAVNLNIAIPYLRDKFATTYGSRALHYLLSYTSIYKYFSESGTSDNAYDWAEFLQKYSVPPLKIYPSADPKKVEDIEEIDCQDIIDRLDSSGPNVGPEEKKLQEILYNNPKCREYYFNKFKRATHAGDPNLTKENLVQISESLKESPRQNRLMQNEALRHLQMLYKHFYAVLDPESLMSLILACLQKKLGIDLSIEGICEAAITELIKKAGVDAVIGLAIANALASPNREQAEKILAALGEFRPSAFEGLQVEAVTSLANETGQGSSALIIDENFDNAPVATAIVVSGLDFDEDFKTPGITLQIIETIKNLEKSGIAIEYISNRRPISSQSTINVPWSYETDQLYPQYNQTLEEELVQSQTFDVLPTSGRYTKHEIEKEKERLLQLGYSSSEADVLLVQYGYYIPDPKQWMLYSNLPKTSQLAIALLDNYGINISSIAVGVLSVDAKDSFSRGFNNLNLEYDAGEKNQQDILDADVFVQFVKDNIGITALCQVVLTDLFEGIEELLKDPFPLLESLVDGTTLKNPPINFADLLVRKFRKFNFNFRFPDNLSVDTHMGDYWKLLTETITIMIVTILAQIARLLIEEALNKCLEENNDQGPAPNPVLNRPGGISIPQINLAGLPSVPNVPDIDLASWIKDMVDPPLSTAQLCALLRGDASNNTLLDLLAKTRLDWPQVYGAGVNTIAEISTIFKDLGRRLDLDICEFLAPSSALVTDVCDAVFDRDARCQELMSAGLTQEECQKQIDRELEDLRNKVASLSGFSIGNTETLNKSIPGACADNGFFQLPPGIKYAMETVTDNVVESVKASLMEDLNALKFFTVPPPAVMAMNDIGMLKKVHNMFRSMSKKPFVKTCFAYIGNPYDDSGLTAIDDTIRAKCYPITYNKYSHYGGYITRPNYKLPDPEGSLSEQEEHRQENIKNSFIKTITYKSNAYLGLETSNEAEINEFLNNTEWFEPMHFGMLADDKDARKAYGKINPRSKKAYVSAYLDAIGVEEDLVVDRDYEEVYAPSWETDEAEFYKKFTNTQYGITWQGKSILEADPEFGLVNVGTENLQIADFYIIPGGGITIKEAIDAGYASSAAYPPGTPIPFRKALVNIDTVGEITTLKQIIDTLEDQTSEDNVSFSYLSKKIGDDYMLKDIKPSYMKDLVVTTKHLFKSNRRPNSTLGPIKGPKTRAGANYLRNSYSLDTKLKDINGNANRWYALMSYFVGAIMPNHGSFRTWGGTQETTKDDNPPHALIINEDDLEGSQGLNFISEIYSLDDPDNEVFAAPLTEGEFPVASGVGIPRQIIEPNADPIYNYYSKTSPGFIRLLEILEEQAEKGVINTKIRHAPGKRRIHHFAVAFMELTVREALGLEDDRISAIFPNFASMDAAQGVIFTEGGANLTVRSQDGEYRYTAPTAYVPANLAPDGETGRLKDDPQLNSVGDPEVIAIGHDSVGNSAFGTPARDYAANQILPQYIAFQQIFIPEEHPLALGQQEMYDYFAKNNEPVNKELLQRLESPNEFDQHIGFDSSFSPIEPGPIPVKSPGSSTKHNKFNPDIIRINMPFTIATLNPSGDASNYMAVGQDPNSTPLDTRIIMSFFNDQNTFSETINASVNFDNLIQETKKQADLIYQNVGLPLEKNVNLQLDGIRNVFKVVNGVLDQKYVVDPGIMTDDKTIVKTKYNLEFGKKLDDDVQALIESLYSDNVDTEGLPISQKILSENNQSTPQLFNPFNYKAQIFGKLIITKMQQHLLGIYQNEIAYWNSDNALKPGDIKIIETALSEYGFTALQTAYIHQVFSKLRDSRLQYRKGMRDLWKRILRVEGFNKNSPECVNPLINNPALSQDELENTETDFFNLESIKNRIIQFYGNSVCRDVYEKSDPQDNAARIALLQGALIMMVKIYCLEACFSGLIAWDSYSLKDVLSSEIMTKIIIDNIRKGLPETIDMDFVSHMAADIIKKEERLSDSEFALVRGEQSGLEYLIKKEAKIIETAIEGEDSQNNTQSSSSNTGIFRNRNELNTDLQLQVLKNSDQSFNTELLQKVSIDLADDDVASVFTMDKVATIIDLTSFGLSPAEFVIKDPVPVPAPLTQEELHEEWFHNKFAETGGWFSPEPFDPLDYPLYSYPGPKPEYKGFGTATPIADYIYKPTDDPAEPYEIDSPKLQQIIDDAEYLTNFNAQATEEAINKRQEWEDSFDDPDDAYPNPAIEAEITYYHNLYVHHEATYNFWTEQYIGWQPDPDNPVASGDFFNEIANHIALVRPFRESYEQDYENYKNQQDEFSQLPGFIERNNAINEAIEQNQKISAHNQKVEEIYNQFLVGLANPNNFRSIFSNTGISYAADVRFSSNIYTMNYGHGFKEKSIFQSDDNQSYLTPSELYIEQNLFDQKTTKDVEDILSKNNRNFFHSLPIRGRYLIGKEFKGTDGNSDYLAAVLLSSQGFFKAPAEANLAFNFPNTHGTFEEEYEEFRTLTAFQRDMFGMSHAFTKENYVESTFGSKENAKLGNVIKQPYVRLIDTTTEEREKMTVDVYQEINTDSYGEPCEPKLVKFTFSANEHEEFFQQVDNKRDFDKNIFYSELRGYIPMSAWSYYFTQILMKSIYTFPVDESSGLNPLLELYKKYGFKLFYKNYFFGIRMSYTIPTDTLFNSEAIADESKKGIQLTSAINNAMQNYSSNQSLQAKKLKCILNQRPYALFESDADAKSNADKPDSDSWALMDELTIPIVEVEREIIVDEGQETFSYSGQTFNLDEIGTWDAETFNFSKTQDMSDNQIKHVLHNPHQFFYKNMAQDLVDDLTNSAEFKLMYEYLFPMKNFMSLGFSYSGEGLTKFLPDTSDLLEESKETIFAIINNIIKSNDYKFLPTEVSDQLKNEIVDNMAGTRGKEPNMTKMILKIVYETAFTTLKYFVEMTDPAVIIAQKIIDVANAVVTAALAAVETILNTAKSVLAGLKLAQESAAQQVKMYLLMAAAPIQVTKDLSLDFPADPEDENSPRVKDLITIKTEGDDVHKWEFTVDPSLKGPPPGGETAALIQSIDYTLDGETIGEQARGIYTQLSDYQTITEFNYKDVFLDERTYEEIIIPNTDDNLDLTADGEENTETGTEIVQIWAKFPDNINILIKEETYKKEFSINPNTGIAETVRTLKQKNMQPGWYEIPQTAGSTQFIKTDGDSAGEYYKKLSNEQKQALAVVVESVKSLQDQKDTWVSIDKELAQINEDLENTLKEIEDFHRKAKNTFKKIFKSPYLLPSLWGAMLPSMTPYFGGLVPPPLIIGPPSTVPGMIYIALLLIDAIDEKIHDDVFSPEEPCIDEL